MKTKPILIAALLLTLLAACGPLTPLPIITPATNVSETPTPSDYVLPPIAMLEVNGQTQEAGLGSYCWTSAGVNTCYDLAGISTPLSPLELTEFPANAKFHFKTNLAPDKLTMAVIPIAQDQDFRWADDFHRLWNPNLAETWSGSLPPKVSVDYPFQKIEFTNGDGLYIIHASASWQNLGDVSYGFLIQIGAGSQQVDITPAASIPTPELVSLPVMNPIAHLGKGVGSSVALSADGERLAVNTPLGIYVYETKTQKEVWFLLRKLNNNYEQVLDFSPDGKRLAIGWENGGVLVVSADTGKTLYHITTEESGQPDWSSDGTKLLTGAGCQEVRVWDANSGELLHTVQEAKCNNASPNVVRAVWSWDGRRIYVNNGYGMTLAWGTLTYQPLADYQPKPPDKDFWQLEIIPSPVQNLFALSSGWRIVIMDGESGVIVKTLVNTQNSFPVGNISWSPDGKFIAANDHYLAVWDVTTGQQIAKLDGYRLIPGISWMPDNKTLMGLFLPDGSLNAVDFASGQKIFSLESFGSSSHPKWDGSELLTYDDSNVVRWDAITGKAISRSVAPSPPDWSRRYGSGQALSPDEKRVALGGVVVDAETGQELVSLKDDARNRRNVAAWSPDGKLIVSGDFSGPFDTVVWNAQTGEILIRLDNPYSYLGSLSWSADGKQIAGGRNGFISIWDSQTGQELWQFSAGIQSERVYSLAWSPNGHWLAAGTISGRIVLWDMLTRQPVASLEGHADQVNGLSWSDDSTMLASSSSDGTVLIWKMP